MTAPNMTGRIGPATQLMASTKPGRYSTCHRLPEVAAPIYAANGFHAVVMTCICLQPPSTVTTTRRLCGAVRCSHR